MSIVLNAFQRVPPKSTPKPLQIEIPKGYVLDQRGRPIVPLANRKCEGYYTDPDARYSDKEVAKAKYFAISKGGI